MSKKKKLIPQLRFPEFVNEAEWERKKFEELFEIGNGRDYKHLSKGEIPVYGSGGYMLSVNDYLYDGESVCIGRKGTIDKPMFLKGKFWTVDTLFYTHSFKDCIPEYIHYVFQNIDWLKHNEAGGVPSLSKTNIYKIETLVPKPKEQQKIASFLLSLDEVIEAHSQKLELLKEHKKGLMQNLFPQEGEKVPRLRFKEFKDQWVKTRLVRHIDLVSGFAFQSIYFSEKGQKLITPKNFTKYGIASFSNENTKYTTEASDDKYVCRSEDLLILLTDLTPSCELLGKPVMLKKEDGDVLLNQRIAKVLFKGELYDKFLLQFFLTDLYHKRIKNTASGSTVRHTSNKIILDTELFYPSNINEQKKIAQSLSSLDNLIKDKANKIEQLKLHKKGLMQRLFPKND